MEHSIQAFETFDTIEGECKFAGLPMTHLTSPTCKSMCHFCNDQMRDPDFVNRSFELSPLDMAHRARRTGHVLVGCGDVFLQPNALDFIAKLTELIPRVVVETPAVSQKSVDGIREVLNSRSFKDTHVMFNITPDTDFSILPLLRPEKDAAKIVSVTVEDIPERIEQIERYSPRVWTTVFPWPFNVEPEHFKEVFNYVLTLGESAFSLQIRAGLLMHFHIGIK